MSFLLLLFIYMTFIIKCVTPDKKIISEIYEGNEIVLSRKKRYLIFPEGSSLQLVYCLTVPSIGMGQIFTIGSTAALAWELPHMPYRPLRKQKEEEKEPKTEKRVDDIREPSSGGWTSHDTLNDNHQKLYYKTFMTNNLFNSPYNTSLNKNYQTIYNSPSYRRYYKWKEQQQERKNIVYHTIDTKNNDRNHDDSYIYPDYHFIHRKTRRDLYSKIQKFFTAQNKDGKACLLKAICEVGNVSNNNVGTFMEEILKAIFMVKPHDNYRDEDEYDMAYKKNHNCTDIYPTCKSSVWNVI